MGWNATSGIPIKKLREKYTPNTTDLILLEDSENNYQKASISVGNLLVGIAPTIITDADIMLDTGNAGNILYRFYSMNNSIKYLIVDLTTIATINLPPMNDGQQYTISNMSRINEIYLYDQEGSRFVTAVLPGKTIDIMYYGGAHYPDASTVFMAHCQTTDTTPQNCDYWIDSFLNLPHSTISTVSCQLNITDNVGEHAVVEVKAKFRRVGSGSAVMLGGSVIDKWATVNMETTMVEISSAGNMLIITITGVPGMTLFTKGFLTISNVNTLN